jgi:hypothetical protein
LVEAKVAANLKRRRSGATPRISNEQEHQPGPNNTISGRALFTERLVIIIIAFFMHKN